MKKRVLRARSLPLLLVTVSVVPTLAVELGLQASMLHYKEESESHGVGAVSRTRPHDEQQMRRPSAITARKTRQTSTPIPRPKRVEKLPINWHSSYQENIADDNTSRTSDRLPLLLIRLDLLSLSPVSLPASIMN